MSPMNQRTLRPSANLRYPAYYVSKSGNDTTGDGTKPNPWLTISKALTTVPIAGGCYILVGAGTYAENTVGLGYLRIGRVFTNPVTVESESRARDVIIRGSASATYSIHFELTTAKLKFKNIDFTPQTITRAIVLMRGENVTDVTFDNCKFPAQNNEKAIEIYPAIGKVISGVSLTNCEITTPAGSTSSFGMMIGDDGLATGSVVNLTISGCTITGINHCILLGGSVNGATLTGNIITGQSSYGIVVKECTGVAISNNVIAGGTNATLYFKAANNSSATNNQLTNSAGGVALRAAQGDTGNKFGNLTFTGNHLTATGASPIYAWAGDVGDSGGCVVDYNEYTPGAAGFGAVRADANVLSLAELQAAWTGYGDGSNDSHSTVV
jgi:hypothetical protein